MLLYKCYKYYTLLKLFVIEKSGKVINSNRLTVVDIIQHASIFVKELRSHSLKVK